VVSIITLPFLEVRKLSSRGTYCMSYTSVVLGSKFLSLLIRYTAYLKASSALLSFWSSVNIAPVIIQPQREIQSIINKSQKISENLKKYFHYKIPNCRVEEITRS